LRLASFSSFVRDFAGAALEPMGQLAHYSVQKPFHTPFNLPRPGVLKSVALSMRRTTDRVGGTLILACRFACIGS
jgi:hypothetical protein